MLLRTFAVWLWNSEINLSIWGAFVRADLAGPRIVANVLCDLPVASSSVLEVEMLACAIYSVVAEVEVPSLVVDVLIDSAATWAGSLLVGLVPLSAKVTEWSGFLVLSSLSFRSFIVLTTLSIGGEGEQGGNKELSNHFYYLLFYNARQPWPLLKGSRSSILASFDFITISLTGCFERPAHPA